MTERDDRTATAPVVGGVLSRTAPSRANPPDVPQEVSLGIGAVGDQSWQEIVDNSSPEVAASPGPGDVESRDFENRRARRRCNLHRGTYVIRSHHATQSAPSAEDR